MARPRESIPSVMKKWLPFLFRRPSGDCRYACRPCRPIVPRQRRTWLMISPHTIQTATSIRRCLSPVVLCLLCCGTTLQSGEASEVRYRVIKIIEGSGTSVPEAGGSIKKV